MGTLFTLIFYAPDDSTAQSAADLAFKRIEQLNTILSDYDPNSNLNKLSERSGSDKYIPVDSTLFTVVSKSQEVAEETNGAFDITIGPFVRLWREIRQMEEPKLPDRKVLKDLSTRIGYQNVALDSSTTSIALEQENMQLDLGAIAKGYTTDEVLRILGNQNIHSALIDAGGDIRVGDPPPGKNGWIIRIPVHTKEGTSNNITLQLSNRAVATSGDLFQYVYINGERYSHIINPKSGMGLTTQSMVTVIAPDGITADSYASALSVMDAEEGISLINQKCSVEGRIEYQHQTEEGIKINQSAHFNRLILDSE
ncbi:FAD:protein FMN transferase [Aliifodinibius salicampi]|uniref:FAD:protein FMN transferase n=1 Tax=Fodinibius salicampi TaxID=1920655 RepID=A0ABT3PVK7_9BACT|nr:FAD:protein FMN transferase [Fodinibius salicampi]MCW9711889.1 FAD:protein FMN transferase [Fodinibius salicampi]